MKRLPKPVMVLNDEEIRIIAAYRTMDQRSRERYQSLMDGSAKNFPLRVRPVLRIVKGGVK